MGWFDGVKNFFGGGGGSDGATSTGGTDWTSLIGPALSLGATVYGASKQADMADKAADAERKSYKAYLNTINPPDEVKETRFNELKSQVLSQVPGMQRRLEDQLASRGIRGAGAAAPIGDFDEATQKALNDAYFKIYGQYNVPNTPGPATAAPSTTDILGSNLGQVGAYMLPYWAKKIKLDPSSMKIQYDDEEDQYNPNKLLPPYSSERFK